MNPDVITLCSSDGKEFTLARKEIELSITIKGILDDCPENNVIPISSVKAETLGYVVEWCIHNYHHPDPPIPEADKYRTDNITPWNAELMKRAQDRGIHNLFQIVLAANYLDIKGMLDLGLKTIASLMKGKSSSEIKEQFKLPDDMKPSSEISVA